MRRLIIRLLIVSIIVGLNINPGYSQLLINEILSSNITVSRDPQFYNYGDWIEIYNAGSSSVNLYNYRVTDDINYPDKYIIDYSIYIGAHSYKIIWADQEDYNLHTNFSLDSDGEFIALVSPGGTIVDSITYKKQIPDVSYGRYPDGSSNWVYFGEPTQESSNSSPGPADLTQAPDVGFSAAPGFYSSSQSIELSTSSPSAAIHYTTDGSVPDENSTIYSSPVVVSSTTVIRAKSYESGYLPGKICVSTYFINESFDIPVVSLSTDPDNFFSGSYGIFVEGWNGVVGWCREEPANWFRDWERPINFEYYEPDGERKINQLVGAKLAGKCSRNWPSKSIALISREKYGQKGIYYKFFNDKDNTYFKSIVLRNSGNDFEKTMLRDGFMQNLLIGRMDIDYQEYQPAVVFLNGEYWGILNLREKINEHYAESNYGINSDSVSVMEKNLVLLHGTDEHYLNMLDYINSHNLGVQENFDYVSTQMDVNEYMDYFIFNIFINNGDWPQNNIKYWRENNSTGRWRWMLFDTDVGFGCYQSYAGMTVSSYLSYVHWSREVIRGLMQNQNYENEFVQRFAAHLNTTFKPERVIGILDSISGIINSKMPRHIDKWGMPSTYETHWIWHIGQMENYAIERIPNVTNQLKSHFGITGTYNLETSVSGTNTGRIRLCEVDITGATEGTYFDNYPVRLEAVPREGYKFIEWTGDISNTSNPVSLTFSSDVFIQANFGVTDTLDNIFINEFAASNTGYTDEHGEVEDWIEIYNGNGFDVDIGGLYISDSLRDPVKFQIPAGNAELTTIPSYGYLILWADGQPEQGELHLNFRLGSGGEELCLAQKVGETTVILDSVYFDDQYINTTYGRYPDSHENWCYLIPTPGSSNTTNTISGVVINEFSADNDNIISDENGEYDDWIEIFNTTGEPVNIGGMFVTDSLADPVKYRIPDTYPDSTTIPAFGHLVLWADNQEEQGILHLGFRLGRNGEQIGLVDFPGSGYIDSLTYDEQYSNASTSRYPDGGDTWIYPPPTPGSTNALPVISGLYINEFSASNTNIITDENGEYEDWIEIYNSSASPVDIGGLFITDNFANPMKFRIPSTDPDSTTLPPHGYMVLWADNQDEQGVLHIGFSLGRGGEQIGLVSYDGTTFINSFAFGEQYSNSSSSRYPDGNNTWLIMSPTPGNTNTLPIISGLYINEFSANNSNIITDENGESDDYIEIFNSTGSPVDIGGLYITDSLGDPVKYRIPSTYPDSTTVPPHGYLLLWADNQVEQGILHLDFKLGRDGDQIGLAGYNGIDYIDSLTYDEQYSNSSSSRYPDGDDLWLYVPPTPGSTNTLPIISGLYINEFSASNTNIIADENGEYGDWIEIYNSTGSPVNIGGLFLTDSLGNATNHRIPSTYPDSTTIPAHGYLVIWADNQEEQGVLHLDFSLARGGEQIGLAGYNGTDYIDAITYEEQYSNSSSSRYPDGNDAWVCPPPTPGSANALTVISGLYINEFSASNTTITADEHGEYEDWIEIYNSTSQPVNAGGLFVTDSLGDPVMHRIPTTYPDSTTIPAHGYLVLWADNQEEQGVLHLELKLGRNGEQIGLAGYKGLDYYIDSLTYGEQYANSSSSRYPDGNNKWINAPSTPGSTNEPYEISGIYINEFMPDNGSIIADEHGEFDDWIEIYNSTDEPVDLGGLLITDDMEIPALHRIPTTCPDSTTVPANGYLVLWADNQEEQGVLHVGFKLDMVSDDIGLAVYTPDKPVYIDSASYNFYISNSKTYAKLPDGTGSWIISNNPTPNNPNLITSVYDYNTNGYRLDQNLPNPFYQETVIGYYLPEDEYVAIEIYNTAGMKVRTLFAGRQTGGSYNIKWNATNEYGKTVPKGIYICTMTTRTYRASKMIVHY